MKVILTQDIDKFGKLGEIVEVKDGFARNYLIPQGLARVSTPQAQRMIEAARLKSQRLAETEKKKAEEFADKLSKASCTVAVQVGPDEQLYGAVTPADIEGALGNEGFQIDKKAVSIDVPIDKLGVYYVTVKVHPEVKANVKVWVVKK